MPTRLQQGAESSRAEFAVRGYCVLRQALPTGRQHAASILAAYARWFAGLYQDLRQPADDIEAAIPEYASRSFSSMSLTARFAVLLGMAGAHLLEQLSSACGPGTAKPGKPLLCWDRRHWEALLADPQLRVAVRTIAGDRHSQQPEVQAVFCLHGAEIELMDRVAMGCGGGVPAAQEAMAEITGSTNWCMRHGPAQVVQGSDQRLNVLVPLSRLDQAAGTLWLIPGSHCYGARQQPLRQELKRQLSLELACGDLLLFHHNLFFRLGSTPACGASAIWLMLQY